MGFNYTKWSFIIGTAIGLTAIVAGLTNPEIRCGIGLDRCTAENSTTENELIDIIVKEDNLQPIQGVQVSFISKGAPEVVQTDSNGYAQIKIPSRGDINVNLLKDGYQPQTFTINLKNNKENTRIYTLRKSKSQTVSSITPINTPNTASETDSQNKGLTSSTNNNNSVESSTANCQKISGYKWQNYTENISIGRKLYLTTQRLARARQQVTCRIVQNTGVVKFIYAIPDDSNLEQAKVVFFVDGNNKVKTINVKRGGITPVTIDVSNANSYAIDYESNGRDYLYTLGLETIE